MRLRLSRHPNSLKWREGSSWTHQYQASTTGNGFASSEIVRLIVARKQLGPVTTNFGSVGLRSLPSGTIMRE